MKKLLVLSLVLLLVISCLSAWAQPFILSERLENRWRWLPASGNPDTYIIEKYSQGQWAIHSQVPATVTEGFVYASIISPGVEIYKIRVIAVDATGNQSIPSGESEWLLVFPQAGRPEISNQ